MANIPEYKKFLAEQILTEDKVITYRYLSRSVGVGVNVAKQMLYEFHKSQNERKPDSIHATYLVYGVKPSDEPLQDNIEQDGDVEMTSSMPEPELHSEQIPVLTVTLVKEESLHDCLAQHDQVTSIHVYSIGRHPMSDPQLLSDAARQVFEIPCSEDALKLSRKLGNISNSQVKRRDRKGAAVPAPVAVKSEPKPKPSQPLKSEPPKSQATVGKSNAPEKDESKSQAAPSAKAAAPPASSATGSQGKKPPPSMKRGGSGGLMQAFAKAKPKKKVETASQAQSTDAAMSDDGEDDSDAVAAPKNVAPADEAAGRKTRKEREDELKRMMEEDDDDVDEEKEREDTPMEEPEEEPEPEPSVPVAPEEPEEPAEVVSTSKGDGRRRGRKRVMRKKQVMDDQGYLVTIQEAAWESFSEDETPASSSKQAKPAVAAPATAPAAKGKKVGGKGQGNIMSFFAKK